MGNGGGSCIFCGICNISFYNEEFRFVVYRRGSCKFSAVCAAFEAAKVNEGEEV